MKQHRLFVLCLLSLVLTLLLAAPGAVAQPVLQVWITWGDNPAQLQELFNQYGDAHGVTVEVSAPVTDEKVIAGLAGTEPPDILVTGGPGSVGSWARQGLIVPLDDVIAANNIDMEDMFEAPLGQCQYQGQYYCLPWGTDTYALFWNKDLFEEAGLDPEKPPETLEELAEYAEKLTIVEADGTVTQLGFKPDEAWSHINLYTRMFGGYWYNEDGTELTFTSQPVVDALLWQQQFYCKYDVDEVLKFTSGMGDYMTPDQGFYAGNIAMYVDGEWQTGVNFIQKYKPELNYGVAPFPYPEANPERKNTNVLEGTVVMIPNGVADPEAAGQLFAWMMSPEIVAEEMVANFNLPTTQTAAEDPRFHENEKFEVFLSLMSDPNATTGIYTAINAEVDTELGLIEEQALHACADPLPLLEEAQARLQPTLDEVLGQ